MFMINLAKDVWRKKFYAEKKKTPELEERVDMLTKEINGNESKMYISLEAELKSMNVASSNRQEKEARVSNLCHVGLV